MSIEYIEPAFPSIEVNLRPGESQSFGMSLRDYFAAKALQGMLSDSTLQASPEEFAEFAYKNADAMMKERSK